MNLHSVSFRSELAGTFMPCPAEKEALSELQRSIRNSLKETVVRWNIAGECIFIDDDTIVRWMNMGQRQEFHIPEGEMIHDFTRITLTGLLYPNNSAGAWIAIVLLEKDHQMKRCRDVDSLEIRFPTVVPFKNEKKDSNPDSE